MARYAPVFRKLDKNQASHVLVVGLISNWRQSLMQLIISCQDNPHNNPFFTFIVTQDEEEALSRFKNALPELGLVAEFRFIRNNDRQFFGFDNLKLDLSLPPMAL
jgi:hypothetical protein